MIEIGKYNTLEILRQTSVGVFLGDEEGEDVLLPRKYVPAEFDIGQQLEVFVYLDHEERKVATTLKPAIELHKFALLKVAMVTRVGAFMDWGLEKELLVPYREQRQKMEEGRSYIVYLDIDRETYRLFGSNKLEKYLDNTRLTVSPGDKVDLLVNRKTDLGYAVIIDHKHKGLLFESDVFKRLKVGDTLQGYVRQIREDNKIDVTLSAPGYRNFNDVNVQKIYTALRKNDGKLWLSDKSSPEEIYATFGISKKAFKKAVGALYKQRIIDIGESGIRLLES